ncbi:F-box/WD repeat-containing protein 5-like [Saccostrea echinata]|uniref:F-box/WD repeat-containing protein 5-like n=1 Tax=Saccostrea echinata TaxID=191078 RepID=UPI002A82FE55|nr:F-box/WD repeat-containing protein 5-like [Saccostrea echinata]
MEVEEETTLWDLLPDDVILHILSFMTPFSVVRMSGTCRRMNEIAFDEQLWKALFHQYYHIPKDIGIAPGKTSWFQEFKRLYYHTPEVKGTVIKQHTDQVLHVSFSHNGKMFATCSKDGFIKVWNAAYPIQLRDKYDMRTLTWKYTQFSQFNKNDTLLLVSGVHFGSQSTSGEIAVFNLEGEFLLQARVINKPYDVFGTWYNYNYLLSGNLHITGQLQSCSSIILNKGFQDIESEHESVVMGLYRFENQNASSIRTLLVAECLTDTEGEIKCNCDTNKYSTDFDTSTENLQSAKPSTAKDKQSKKVVDNVYKKVQQVTVYEGGALREKMIEVDPEDKISHEINSTITYSQAYRDAEEDIASANNDMEANADVEGCSGATGTSADLEMRSVNSDLLVKSMEGACSVCRRYSCEDNCYKGMYAGGSVYGYPLQSNILFSQDRSHVIEGQDPFPKDKTARYNGKKNMSSSSKQSSLENPSSQQKCQFPDKYLIFTRGSETFTPHQIGIKRMKSLERVIGDRVQVMPNVEENLHGIDREGYDDVDHVIDLHGHIIGLCLSPDDRYLYVNCRQWPKNYTIENPFYPPPIAQEIDIHVIDLMKMKKVGKMYRSHKAYTPNDECFFIFLDVSNEYVASGAEDQHGYIWDRHYGICLHKFPHTDVVNSVAFNPRDPEMLVTASDDHSIVVWQSKNRERQIRRQGFKGKNGMCSNS